MSIASVYCLFASDDEASAVARTVVDERLAACANILGPCRSIYRWKGEIVDGEEVAAIFKTSGDAAQRLVARIAELHSYDNPAIAVWDVKLTPGDYRDWVEAEVGEPSSLSSASS